jgi:hypothetical protein
MNVSFQSVGVVKSPPKRVSGWFLKSGKNSSPL